MQNNLTPGPAQTSPQSSPQPQPQGYPQAPQQQPQATAPTGTPQAPGPVPAPAAPKTRPSGLAIAALVCGIVSIVGSPTFILGLAAGAVALVFGLRLIRREPTGMTRAGLICGGVGAGLSCVLFLFGFSLFGKLVCVPIPDDDALELTGTQLSDSLINSKLPATFVYEEGWDRFDITGIDVYEDGIVIYYSLINLRRSDSIISIYTRYTTDDEHPWYINGIAVNPCISTRVDPNRSENSWFYITSEELPGIESVSDIYSIRGQLNAEYYVDGDNASTATYYITVLNGADNTTPPADS